MKMYLPVFLSLVFTSCVPVLAASSEVLTTDEETEKRLGPWLNLRTGGQAVGPAQTIILKNPDGTTTTILGSLEQGTLLPERGEGFKRLSGADTSWGAGHMISLLENASAHFKKYFWSDHVLHIGDVAQELGGPYTPHSSHQNGLDADVLFMGQTQYISVVDAEGKVTERFDRDMNWYFFKMLASQKMMDGTRIVPVVTMILVAPEIKTEMCRWAKEKGLLEDADNRELMSLLRSAAGHDDHFHIRLRCSPHHLQCRKQNISPNPCPA